MRPTLWPRRALIGLVRAYRLLLKPWLGNACRFEPSCSQYALDALQRHGALAGGTLAGARLLRCHPWCDGGLDPVPANAPDLFSRLGLGSGASVSNRESS
jgi:putative membrane protein insertion efficiency factor